MEQAPAGGGGGGGGAPQAVVPVGQRPGDRKAQQTVLACWQGPAVPGVAAGAVLGEGGCGQRREREAEERGAHGDDGGESAKAHRW